MKMGNRLKKLIFIATTLYLILVMAAFLSQEKLIFHPEKLPKNFRFDLAKGGEELFLTTEDQEKINALFFPGNKSEVILYFHGNAGSLAGWQQVADDFTSLGYSILIIDYRGYGKSSGKITEKGLYLDAFAAFHFLTDKKDFSPDEIIIYGRSIGSGIATDLASKRLTKGLVLESPFSNLKKLATQKMPFLFPSLFLQFHFDNIGKLDSVNCPILLIHGGNDALIPVSHAQNLHKAYSGKKKLVIIPQGTHNDLSLFDKYHETLILSHEFFSPQNK
ncbi:alpha/beta hydrolase [Fulvivirga sp. 29W222]|uniref:Alpha/beta hydrolase n=1 Tax=Fulvivirga marina TaxID=2494733 RepID=A0A937FZ98_9BACT|nr:alpha/beta hydrolase [Fulvivirga marina]MBL6447090.1 alpha/beta hydrolase [Fulvivirga marina]